MGIEDIRREYEGRPLSDEDAGDDPLQLFAEWFDEAFRILGEECNAMALSTAGADGKPSVRIVLLKEYSGEGFVFYTNYESRKGRELAANPFAALCLYWAPLHRQIRIEGPVEKLSADASDRYFSKRPRLSQLAAAASPQSETIADREEIEANLARLDERYPDGSIPRPPFWGGYRLVARWIEFWQGQPGRLHDRIAFERTRQGWAKSRLAP